MTYTEAPALFPGEQFIHSINALKNATAKQSSAYLYCQVNIWRNIEVQIF